MSFDIVSLLMKDFITIVMVNDSYMLPSYNLNEMYVIEFMTNRLIDDYTVHNIDRSKLSTCSVSSLSI